MTDQLPRVKDTAILCLVAIIALTFVVFGLFPWIDLKVSTLFYDPQTGFLLAQRDWSEGIRMGIWDLTILMLLATVYGVIASYWGRKLFGVPGRAWAAMLGLFLLGPGLLTNVLLKQLWGRARPAEVTDFGGIALFTPPHVISDNCSDNCSFVSGEMSGTVAMTICLLLILWFWRQEPRRPIKILVSFLALVLPIVTGIQRIAAGRHFFSDVIFAGLFMALIAAFLLRLLSADDRGGNPG